MPAVAGVLDPEDERLVRLFAGGPDLAADSVGAAQEEPGLASRGGDVADTTSLEATCGLVPASWRHAGS